MGNKNRRKAVDCKLVEASKTSPGYFKYQVTIEEVDGTIHTVPAYGKDMQDAINRLIWNERYDVVTESKITTPLIITLLGLIVVLAGIIASETNQPVWILSAIGFSVVFGLSLLRIEKYLKK